MTRPEIQQRLLHYAKILISILICATGSLLQSTYSKDPEPYHTSILSGEGWLMELLTGHPEHIRCELGMHAHAFEVLISELRNFGYVDSKFVSLEEQVAIFLYTSITGLTTRHVGERFQRSNDTISRYFKRILHIFSSPPFYTTYVHLPDGTSVSKKIKNNPKFWPFFRDAVGALDGSHIHASPPAFERTVYRNRKGFVSQNCLFACDFDLNFVHSLTGWEGSANDSRIYEDAHAHDFHIPRQKYYLADAGFPLCPELLVPYRGVRYHLAEWGRANIRPINKEELFNLRHASARNVIERIFGVLKCRFRILLLAPEYPLDTQARIPAALCAIHNFLRLHDPSEDEDEESHGESYASENPDFQGQADDNDDDDNNSGHAVSGRAMRERIAQAMWDQYQDVIHERALLDSGSDSEVSDALDESELESVA